MATILITGATGNIGTAIIDNYNYSNGTKVLAGVRDISKRFTLKPVENTFFDFENLEKSKEALKKSDVLFLLRPPHISDVKGIFKPLIEACQNSCVKHIVFLSVQGVEKSKIIPHHKIEKLIEHSGISYTFLRPGYFMQNLTGNLKKEIIEKNAIYVPAGDAKFNWIDAEDIGKAAAAVLLNPADHMNNFYTLTGKENLTFKEVALQMSEILNRKIEYVSPGLLQYSIKKKKDGLPLGMIFVMIMLHFLPRFDKEPAQTQDLKYLTTSDGNSLKKFLRANKNKF